MFCKIHCRQIFVLVIICLCTGCMKNRFERGYVFREPDVNLYDATKEITIKGAVATELGLVYDQEVPISSFTVTTNDEKKYLVQLGPSWYVKMEHFSLKSGDQVLIIGSPVGREELVATNNESDSTNIDDSELVTLLARKIKKIGKYRMSISLRDEKGKPLWYGKGQYLGKQRYLKKMIEEGKPIRKDYADSPF